MNLPELIVVYIFGGVVALAAIAALLGVAWSQFTKGQTENNSSNDSIYKERIEALELKVKSQSTQMDTQDEDIKKLTKEVQDLHAAIDARDKRFAEAILTLQGKDPDMQKFTNLLMQYVEDNKPFIENIKMRVIPVVMKLDKYLDMQQIK